MNIVPFPQIAGAAAVRSSEIFAGNLGPATATGGGSRLLDPRFCDLNRFDRIQPARWAR
jgi:hypothetical protein